MVERTLISFSSQLQLIDRLQHLLYLSSSMVFISGEKGSGKTTLIEQLSNQLPSKTQQAFVTLVEPISVAQIRLQIISQLFEQPLFDADDTLFNSLSLLKAKKDNDIARVIVFDNGSLLPEQLLLELAEVIKQKSQLTDNEINFILLGDESNNNQMVQLLKQSSIYQGIAALSFKLPPLTIAEAKQLLRHSLEQVGYSAKIQHQDALAKQLFACHGIPEKILLLATEVSSGNLDEDKESWLKTRFPALFLMVSLVLIATLLGFYLYPRFIKPEADVDIVVETEELLLDEIPLTNIVTTEGGAIEPLAGQWSNAKKAIDDNQLSVGIADNEQRVVISESLLFKIEQSASTATIGDSSLAISEEHESQTPMAVTKVNEELVSDESASDSEIEASISEVEMQPLHANSEPLNELESIEVVPNDSSVMLKNEISLTPSEILLAIDPDKYTLQLAGLSSEKSLNTFIENYQLPQKDVYLYQTMRNGEKWFVVIYGQFDSREIAIKEAGNRPTILKKLDTWAKKYALVHRDLQLNEQ
jgi:DamX protein